MGSRRARMTGVSLLLLVSACGSDYSILGIGGHSDSHADAPVDAGGGTDAGESLNGPDSGTPPLDSGSVMPMLKTCHAEDPFGAPAPVAEVNSATLDGQPKVSANELVMTFGSLRAMTGNNANWAPFISTRAKRTDPWGTPVIIAELDDATGIDADPFMTEDGLTAYVSSNRGGLTGLHLFVATRTTAAAPFGTPMLVTAVDVANKNTEQAQVSPSGNDLYFVGDSMGSPDLYRAPLGSNGVGAPTRVSELSTAAADSDPALTGDELTMFFTSERAPTVGQGDVWVTTRPSLASPWGAPRHVTELSTAGADAVGSVSRDGCRIWFARCTGTGLACLASFDIFVATKAPR
jgi:hypothetical protein